MNWRKDRNNSGDKDEPRSVQKIEQVVLRLTLVSSLLKRDRVVHIYIYVQIYICMHIESG